MNANGRTENSNDLATTRHGPHSACAHPHDQPAHAGTAGDGLLHWLGTGITPTCLPWAPDQGADEYSK
jgi:hypothetical protein